MWCVTAARGDVSALSTVSAQGIRPRSVVGSRTLNREAFSEQAIAARAGHAIAMALLAFARGSVWQVCYSRGVAEVASRELRNDTRSVLRRVEAGEDVVITVDGRPVAVLHPVGSRPRWLARRQFVDRFGGRQADPGLTDDLRALAPDTTDDLP